jgi:hypothetical protein
MELQFRHYRVWVEEEVVGVSCPWGGLKGIRTLERRREGIGEGGGFVKGTEGEKERQP